MQNFTKMLARMMGLRLLRRIKVGSSTDNLSPAESRTERTLNDAMRLQALHGSLEQDISAIIMDDKGLESWLKELWTNGAKDSESFNKIKAYLKAYAEMQQNYSQAQKKLISAQLKLLHISSEYAAQLRNKKINPVTEEIRSAAASAHKEAYIALNSVTLDLAYTVLSIVSPQHDAYNHSQIIISQLEEVESDTTPERKPSIFSLAILRFRNNSRIPRADL